MPKGPRTTDCMQMTALQPFAPRHLYNYTIRLRIQTIQNQHQIITLRNLTALDKIHIYYTRDREEEVRISIQDCILELHAN